jgi:lipid II:glycine glycyltransferase (peptidoglycan interpeptide bridge formation enzyme)
VSRRRLILRIVPRQVIQDAEGTCFVQICKELGFQQDHDVKPYHTFRVDLSQPPEVIRKRFDQKWRNQLNAAERNGLEILCGTSDELYDKFLALYADMMARKQFQTTVDVHEFRRIQARLPAKQKMLIMISLLEGKPMTGLVSTAVGETGIYLLGATSTEGMRSKGSYLLQWQMVRQLKERGCRWYDLGGINPEENPGVYHFKQGMGGEEVHGHGRTTLSTGRVGRVAVAGAERLRNFVKLLRGQRWALKRR